MTLIARDGVCVVTREPYGACQAAHLVPQTRLDVSSPLVYAVRRKLTPSVSFYRFTNRYKALPMEDSTVQPEFSLRRICTTLLMLYSGHYITK